MCPPRSSGKSSRRKRRRWSLWRVAAACVLVVLALPPCLVLPWRWIDPPTSAFMLFQQPPSAKGVRQRWVPWEEISPSVPIAFVAAEDQRFPEHHGFDLLAIREALDDPGERPKGASTITQQVAKNLFLWPGRSLVRKAVELYFSVWIELLWPKRRILEVYVNIAELGPGVYGVGAASEVFFGQEPSRLSNRQAALLAAVLPSPRTRSVSRPSLLVLSRSAWIQRQMRQLGGPDYLADL